MNSRINITKNIKWSVAILLSVFVLASFTQKSSAEKKIDSTINQAQYEQTVLPVQPEEQTAGSEARNGGDSEMIEIQVPKDAAHAMETPTFSWLGDDGLHVNQIHTADLYSHGGELILPSRIQDDVNVGLERQVETTNLSGNSFRPDDDFRVS